MNEPVQDRQSVTADGQPIGELIDGVKMQPSTIHVGDRGTMCELFNRAWGVHDAPLVHVYRATIRPGKIKGWIEHHVHDDRLMVVVGECKIVLFDNRPDSPTHEMINELYVTEHNPTLVVIPAHVFHALENIGNSDMMFVNFPTTPYNYEQPDKYRLPLKNDRIPYSFEERRGW